MMQLFRSRRDDRGAAVVEMAFIAPFLVLLALGIIDLSRALYTDITINEAAQEGAIYASFEARNLGEVQQAVINSVDSPDLNTADTVITYTCPRPLGEDDEFTIRVTHDLTLITPFAVFWGGSIQLESEIDGQIFYGECL